MGITDAYRDHYAAVDRVRSLKPRRGQPESAEYIRAVRVMTQTGRIVLKAIEAAREDRKAKKAAEAA